VALMILTHPPQSKNSSRAPDRMGDKRLGKATVFWNNGRRKQMRKTKQKIAGLTTSERTSIYDRQNK